MDSFRNILVYVDDRSRARFGLERAVELARRSGARLRVLRVLEPVDGPVGRLLAEHGGELADVLPSALRRLGSPALSEQIRRAEAAEHREKLERWLGEAHADGVRTEVEIRWGTPFLEILHCAAQGEHDLVMKTAMAPADPGGGLFFGSTAMHLCRKSSVPVWVVAPRPSPARKRVLAAIDAAGSADPRDDLNRRILEHAAWLAGTLEGGELHVVRAWGGPGERRLGRWLARRDPDVFDRALRGDAETGVARIRGEVVPDLPADRVHIVEGAAREAIPALAHRLGVETLVMGSVGRSGIPGLVIGETAESILQRVAYSVLVVKSGDFASPLVFGAA